MTAGAVPVSDVLSLLSQLIEVQGRRASDVRQELIAFRADMTGEVRQMRSEIFARLDKMDSKLDEVCDKGKVEHSEMKAESASLRADVIDLQAHRHRKEGEAQGRSQVLGLAQHVAGWLAKHAATILIVGAYALFDLATDGAYRQQSYATEVPRVVVPIPEMKERLPTP
jgi:hypothetical protein